MLGLCWPYVGSMLALRWPMLALLSGPMLALLALCWPILGPMLRLCWLYVRPSLLKDLEDANFSFPGPSRNQKPRKNHVFSSRQQTNCDRPSAQNTVKNNVFWLPHTHTRNTVNYGDFSQSGWFRGGSAAVRGWVGGRGYHRRPSGQHMGDLSV